MPKQNERKKEKPKKLPKFRRTTKPGTKKTRIFGQTKIGGGGEGGGERGGGITTTQMKKSEKTRTSYM